MPSSSPLATHDLLDRVHNSTSADSGQANNSNALEDSHPTFEKQHPTVPTNTSSLPSRQDPRTAPDSIHEGLFPIDPDATNTSGDQPIYSKETTIATGRDNEEDGFIKASWQLKLVVLLCMLALPVGCHYLEATVGTLKTSLKANMHINNTQFGILVSAVTLVNTVLPLLAGVFIDDLSIFGSLRGTVLVSVLIMVGSLFVSIGSSRNSYPIMVAGQVVYGLGGGMIVTMQEGILSRWFRDRELTIVIGVLLSTARLTKWAAKMICYPIVYATGSYSWPIYVATVLCAIGVVMNGVYWAVMVKKGWATLDGKEIAQPKHNYKNRLGGQSVVAPPATSNGTASMGQIGSGFRFSAKLFLYVPGTFWMIPWIQLLMSSVLSSFDDVATEFVEFRFNTTRIMAGYQSSLTQVVPIIVAPIMGVVVHHYGKRLTNLFVATLVLVTSMVLLSYTYAPPAAGMIVFSLALALGPVSVLSSTSMLLPHEMAGTGMGLHKCANNIGTTIVAVLVGYVQDLTYHDGDSSDNHLDLQSEYNGVMALYLVMAFCATLVVGIFWLMDRKLLGGWLQANKTERNRRLEVARHEQNEEERTYRYPYYGVGPAEQAERRNNALQMIGSLLRQKKTYVYVGIYCFWLIASWIIFFTFALMPVYQKYEV